MVIKADGLAAGKGVIIATTAEERDAAIDAMFDGGFGEAGARIVIEEYMEGEEASYFALVDGETVVPFGSAQDHKRVGEGDTGPNTGGMGAYSPAAVLTPRLRRRVLDEIVAPTARALAGAGTPYSGVLYAGLMLTADGPKLVEYNARFGDPECQPLMMRLESDLLALMLATAKGELAGAPKPRFSAEAALTVVMAARGLSRQPGQGRRDRRPRQSGGGRRQGLPRRHGARGRQARRRRRPGTRRDRARQRTSPPRGAAPIAPSTRSTFRPASAAATSAGAKWRAARADANDANGYGRIVPVLAKLLIGLAAAWLVGWIVYAPLGRGEAFVDRLQADSEAAVAEAGVPNIHVRFARHPLGRRAILSGRADRFQREGMGSLPGLDERVRNVPGVSGVRWEEQSRAAVR